MKNEDTIKSEDETVLALIQQEKPKDEKPPASTMRPQTPPRGISPVIGHVDHVSVGLNMIDVKGPLLDVSEFEYVLAIPKTFLSKKEMMPRGDNPNTGAAAERVFPSMWPSSVEFYVNGIKKHFRELSIVIEDIEVDKLGNEVRILPKVTIHG